MSIVNDITGYIDTAIGTMTTAGGFNFDYTNVNEFKPADATYPNVKTTYLEDDASDIEGNMANKYTSELTAFFNVTVDDTGTVDDALDNVLEDFKKLINDEFSTLQTKGLIREQIIRSDKYYSLVTKRPGRIEIQWMLFYRVSQSDPTST